MELLAIPLEGRGTKARGGQAAEPGAASCKCKQYITVGEAIQAVAGLGVSKVTSALIDGGGLFELEKLLDVSDLQRLPDALIDAFEGQGTSRIFLPIHVSANQSADAGGVNVGNV